jgi:NADH-quinone oxidoreductase subunit F
VWGLQSNIARFRPEFEAAIAAAREQPVLPVRPSYRPDAGAPSGLTSAALPEERRFFNPLRAR